jgi:hypothetical protein
VGHHINKYVTTNSTMKNTGSRLHKISLGILKSQTSGAHCHLYTSLIG